VTFDGLFESFSGVQHEVRSLRLPAKQDSITITDELTPLIISELLHLLLEPKARLSVTLSISLRLRPYRLCKVSSGPLIIIVHLRTCQRRASDFGLVSVRTQIVINLSRCDSQIRLIEIFALIKGFGAFD
jgi:hypothetical protein